MTKTCSNKPVKLRCAVQALKTHISPARRSPASQWVLCEPGSGTRSVFEHALAKLGVDPGALRVTLELPSNEAVRAAAKETAA